MKSTQRKIELLSAGPDGASFDRNNQNIICPVAAFFTL